ncbi:hypothetical protein [Rheinheimera pacifica]|uniref:hypothetical protein n=1 Tax=Rheinheimera pacifica TaxID=173990 RepID=UPI002ED97451
MKNNKKIVALALLALSGNTFAGSIVCEGTVETLAYHADNQLMIKLSSMNVPVFFCSPDSEWVVGGTSYKTGPQTCQTLYSTFLAAQIAGKQLNRVWFDGDAVPASCNSWVEWTIANIRHFALN